MSKHERITAFVAELGVGADPSLDPRYHGYFALFNEQRFYEAHDVLENLWLETRDESRLFYQALIQIAGGFVHLQKQFHRPHHPTDGRRLRPAVRLFRLGTTNLAGYQPMHLRLDVDELCRRCEAVCAAVIASEYSSNPWHPARPFQVHLQ